MPLNNLAHDSPHNPIDVVERLASTHDWSFSRASDDEVTILVSGQWSDYQVSFTWMPDVEALHVACSFALNPFKLSASSCTKPVLPTRSTSAELAAKREEEKARRNAILRNEFTLLLS